MVRLAVNVVLLVLAWAGSVRARGCCTQCKSGYVDSDRLTERLACNIPSETKVASYRDCTIECLDTTRSLGVYCTNCAVNYERRTGSCTGSCTPCPLGTSNSGDADTSCKCPVGTVGLGGSDFPCRSCGAGKRIHADGVQCELCPAGKYQNLVHQTRCEDCVGNTFSEAGYSLCMDQPFCLKGSYVTRMGDTSTVRTCGFCPAGTYKEYRNIDEACDACPAGKYQNFEGLWFCTDITACAMGSRTKTPATAEADTICEACVYPWTTLLGSERSCDYCVAGKFYETIFVRGVLTPSCTDCQCGGGETFINCPAGTPASSNEKCKFCSGTQTGNYCAAGNGPGETCDGTQTQDVPCRPCLAGFHKPDPTTKMCVKCSTGTFKDSAGTAQCAACANKPAGNTYYEAWGTSPATTATCPWQCNAGYYKSAGTCVSCRLTAGKYSLGGESACSSCSVGKKPGTAVFILPSIAAGGFDATSDNCPWTCNAGYQKHADGTLCVACGTGTFNTGPASDLREGAVQPMCQACTECVAGTNYETGACQTTVNRVCTGCRVVCGAGQYISQACTTTANLQCAACVGKCASGKYMNPGKTSCSGSDVADTVASGCSDCLVPGSCPEGQYLSKACDGSEVQKNECVACTRGFCVPGTTYSGGCGGLQPARCLNLTVCAAGLYLDKWSDVSDGVCRACTDCATLTLVTEQVCGRLQDTRCGGGACDELKPCNRTASNSRFCNYLIDGFAPSCGICPLGYTSDGQTCQECPEGKTCSRLGVVECEGQCGPGVISRCDPTWGYARCDTGPGSTMCRFNETKGRLVTRGTYVAYMGDSGDCAPYFRCDVGWYKRFLMQGVADCAPCMSGLSGLALYVTGGLSGGDDESCLWECDTTIAGAMWDSVLKRCVQPAGTTRRVAWHPAGSFGIERDEQFPVSTCRPLHTTRENTALVLGDCVACPAMPAKAVEVVGARNCEWVCVDGWRQRGGLCVRMPGPGGSCADEGTTRLEGSGECVRSAAPWNRAGTRKGWPPVLVASERTGMPVSTATTTTSGTSVRSVSSESEAVGESTILAGSVSGGVSGRHWVTVDGQRVGVEGPVCSVARLAMNGRSYLVCAVCNQSFLAYVDLSTPVDVSGGGTGSGEVLDSRRRLLQTVIRTETLALSGAPTSMRGGRQALQVLIGQAGSAGWADGFKTQARFGVELHVATGGGAGGASVWVLDRWNCVVRQVVVWAGGPGDYRTRAYTVHGSTERFLLVPPSPKCYGPGSLAGPRRFWEVGGGSGLLFFTDDTGLWQLESKSGELARVLDESWGVGTLRATFEADDVVSVRFRVSVVVTSPSYHPTSSRICTTSADCQYFECMKLPGEATCSRYLGRDYLNCVSNGLICPQGYCPVGSIPQFYFGEMICNQCPLGKFVATSSATSCSSGLYELVILVFRDGTEWDIVADTEPCGGDYTSRAGGDCVIGCAWQDGRHYVDPVSGACVACGALQCGVGQQMVKCTRSAPARCEACPVRGSGKAYVVAGRCDEDLMRYPSPCPTGFYLAGEYCEACGDPLKTTFFAGATRVEQCKCKRGLRWSKALGKCVGRDLYAYEDGACVRDGEECLVPNNTVVVDAGRCIWECDVGFFQLSDDSVSWTEKCQECRRGNLGGVRTASTRGDYDSPYSCEFYP